MDRTFFLEHSPMSVLRKLDTMILIHYDHSIGQSLRDHKDIIFFLFFFQTKKKSKHTSLQLVNLI